MALRAAPGSRGWRKHVDDVFHPARGEPDIARDAPRPEASGAGTRQLDRQRLADGDAREVHRRGLDDQRSIGRRPGAAFRLHDPDANRGEVVVREEEEGAPADRHTCAADHGAPRLHRADRGHGPDASHECGIERIGAERGRCRVARLVLAVRHTAQQRPCVQNRRGAENADGDGEHDEDGTRLVLPRVAQDRCAKRGQRPAGTGREPARVLCMRGLDAAVDQRHGAGRMTWTSGSCVTMTRV